MPGLTPVIKPVFEIVATERLLETQGLLVAAVPLPVNCNVELTQRMFEPLIMGLGLTVIVKFALQPKLFK